MRAKVIYICSRCGWRNQCEDDYNPEECDVGEMTLLEQAPNVGLRNGCPDCGNKITRVQGVVTDTGF